MVRQDGLRFIDPKDGSEVIFNYYTLAEIVKGCLIRYSNINLEKANELVENYRTFNQTIKDVMQVYAIEHNHPYHLAMLCLYGHMYWKRHPELGKVPKDYEEWESDFVKEHNLNEDISIVIPVI